MNKRNELKLPIFDKNNNDVSKVSEYSKNIEKYTSINPEKVMQSEDIAELIIAQLKLNRRVFIKNSSIWSTNP